MILCLSINKCLFPPVTESLGMLLQAVTTSPPPKTHTISATGHWPTMLIVSCNLIGWEPASHCGAASDGGQEKEEDPLLTEEVRETTESESRQERERETERETDQGKKIDKKVGVILD